jgi:hypothetical protein
VKLIVDVPVRLVFAFNKIAMEYGLLFQNWNQACQQHPASAEGTQARSRAARRSRHREASIMSCRIDRVVSPEDPVVFRVSGRITAQELGMLQDLLRQESGAVAIDLKDVLLVDREAVKLLAFSEVNGVELRNCPAYIREWVTRERVQSKADGSIQGTGTEDIEDV